MANEMIFYDRNAEALTLSSMLNDNDVIPEAMLLLKEEYFYNTKYREIFRAIYNRFQDNKPIDIATTIIDLPHLKSDIWEIGEMVVSGSNINHYIPEVVRLYEQREARTSLISALSMLESGKDKDMVMVKQILDGVCKPSVKNKMPTPCSESMGKALAQIEEALMSKSRVRGIPTGYDHLDNLIGGLMPGKLILLAARPGLGKSALATCISRNIVKETDKDVLLFSLEMLDEEIATRFISQQSGINLSDLIHGRLKNDQSRFALMCNAAQDEIYERIIIDDNPVQTMQTVRNRTLMETKKNPAIGLIIIDYLQLLSAHTTTSKRNEQVSEMSRAAKSLANETKMPVLALCQLNRDIELREDKRPKLSDLRDSGSLEQDADTVIFLHNENPQDGNMVTVDIAKNRSGTTGKLKLYFKKETTTFCNIHDNQTMAKI